MKIIKILFTIPNFETAGSGNALFQLALGLKSLGHDVHIMAKHDRGSLVKKFKESSLPFYVFDYESEKRPIIKLFKSCWKVSRVFKEIGPDVIYSYHYSSDYSEAVSAFMAGIPWIYVKKNMSWYGPSQNSWELRSRLAKKIIAQNAEMLSEFLYKFRNKVHQIAIGVDTDYFSGKWENKYKKLTFVHVSSLLPVKGVQILLKAFRNFSIKQINDDFQLIIVGPTDSEFVKELINEYHEKSTIYFIGRSNDVKDILSNSHIFIQSSLNEGRREGAPIALQEAMATGLVCIGSKVAGINDQLKGFEFLQYESYNVEELENLLEMVYRMSASQRKAIGMQLREKVIKEYSLENEILEVNKLLLSLCK